MIQKWLLHALGDDEGLVQVARAYLNAIVKGQTDLHRYLELIGPGGSGKSTFQWLARKLVGEENTAVTELKHLESSRFETAHIYGKRLVLVSAAERYTGDVSVLKALTSGDPPRLEGKHKQGGAVFNPNAMVLITANEPIQSSEYTSGLRRRRITMHFKRAVRPRAASCPKKAG